MFKLLEISENTISKLSARTDYKPKKNCNGCGTGWNAKLVPDTIYFLDIKPICCRHDDRYEHGITQEDKKIGDDEMLDNLITAINDVKKWYYPKKLARNRAMTYYNFVVDHGDSAFYKKEEK